MKIFRISKLVCFVAGSVLLFVFKDFFVDNLRWFIGGLMVLYGALGVFNLILEKAKPIYDGNGFLFYFIEILMGSTILILIKEFSTVCIIWAVWSIFRESVELKEILDGELHTALAVLSAIESVAVIVLSIMLITEPGTHHALIHTYLLCVELVLVSSIPIFNHYVLKKHKNGGNEHEETIEEPAAPEEEEIS